MRNICVIMVLILLCAGISVNAQEPTLDWNALQDKLREQGVQPSDVDWTVLQTMCRSYQYAEKNQCLLKKAVLQKQFDADRGYCQKRSQLIWPESFAKHEVVKAKGKNIDDGSEYQFSFSYQRYTEGELNDMRGLQVHECLHLLGWRSTTDWKLGKGRTP